MGHTLIGCIDWGSKTAQPIPKEVLRHSVTKSEVTGGFPLGLAVSLCATLCATDRDTHDMVLNEVGRCTCPDGMLHA